MISKGFKIYFEYKEQEILLSEYTSLKVSTNTLDEELNEEENGRYSLSFRVPKKLENTSNLPTDFDLNKYLKIGRKLRLDIFSKGDFAAPETIYFIISSIAPEGSNDNIMWSIEATDYLSFIFSKNNTELTLDTLNDEDYFDWLEETKETEKTIEFNQRLYESGLFRVGTVKDIAEYILYRGNLRKIDNLENSWKIDYQNKEAGAIDLEDPAHEKVNISLSSSNTYNGLIELTFLTNSTLHIDYTNKTLRFRSKDSDYFRKNYVLSPEFNLQDLSLNYNSETFYPLFFVTGGEDDLGLSVGIIPYLSYNQYTAIKKNIDLVKNPNISTPFAGVLNGGYLLSLQSITGEAKKFKIVFDNNTKFPAYTESVLESIKFNSNLLSSSITIEWSNEEKETFKYIEGHTLRYNGGGLQEISVLNKEGIIIFSKSLTDGIYDGVRRYFNIEIQFNTDIDPSEYENVLGNELNGYYTNLFSSSTMKARGEEVLHTLNFIPYLDSFILTLDYFLNNDFLDIDEILDIKNRIYNDLRYVNLDYQLAVFNKYTIEGQIKETEQEILNYADQLAVQTEANYFYVNNELQNIFFKEAGGALKGIPKNIGFTNLDATWDVPMPNSADQKTFRELMSDGFFFYEISSDEYQYFLNEERPEWDGTSPVPNKVIYSYEIGGADIYMASYSFTLQYPFNATIKVSDYHPDFQSINNREHQFNTATEEFTIDEVAEGLKNFNFSNFSNPISYKFFISGNFVSKSVADVSSPPLKLQVSQYAKRWKEYTDSYGNESYPTYITNLPNATNGPTSVMLVTKTISNEFNVKKYIKNFAAPTYYYQIGLGKLFNYAFKIVGGVRWARIISDPISLDNVKYSSTIKLYVDNTKTENGSSYSWFLQESPAGYLTGIYLTKSGLPDIFVPFSRPSGKNYYTPTDPNFNLGFYEGYTMMISFALNQTNSGSSLETYFSGLNVNNLTTIMVSPTTAYFYDETLIDIDNVTYSELPVQGTIKWDANTIYEPNPSLNTNAYSYKVNRLDLLSDPTDVKFQKFEWYLSPTKTSYPSNAWAIVKASNIIMDTWPVDTRFESYGYFDLLSLYKGSDYIAIRLNKLIQSIKEYIDERIIVENNLTTVQSELEYAFGAELKALEAQVAALEKDLNSYKAIVGDWRYEENTSNLIEGKETGRLTIFYEFFNKFLSQYIIADEKVDIDEIDSIYYKYKKFQKDKIDFWFELKRDYGQYLYEGFYENKIEVNSWNLLLQALKIIKYHQTPSEEYSLTYIDGSQILGKEIELIKVGDYIKIRSEKLGLVESESNEIQVTAISRSLRDFSNIQLTVNQTRRTDSIIENLISGLNK